MRGSVHNSNMTTGTGRVAKLILNPKPRPDKLTDSLAALRAGMEPVTKQALASLDAQIEQLSQLAGIMRDLLAALGTSELEQPASVPQAAPGSATIFRSMAINYLRGSSPATAADIGRACGIEPNDAAMWLQIMSHDGLVRQGKTTKKWNLTTRAR